MVLSPFGGHGNCAFIFDFPDESGLFVMDLDQVAHDPLILVVDLIILARVERACSD